MLRALILALALLAPGLQATPTRSLTLDNSQMLVPDDTDATIYYHLAHNFKNRLYVDALNGGRERAWAFVDLNVGTVALWLNKDYGAKGLFDGVDGNGKLGYLHQDLSSNTGNAQAPLEGWIRDPRLKLAGGFDYEVSEYLHLALCVQWAGTHQVRDSSASDGAGSPVLMGPSLSRYMASGYSPGMQVSRYANTQDSSGLGIAPSIGFATEKLAADLKYETVSNGLNNVHEEKVADAGGTRSGTVTQSLKDKGKGSWLTMGKLRIPFKAGALVLRGGYFDYDFSTQHSQKGSFSGSGFTAAELAGFDHVDAEENFTVKSWDSMLGWTMNSDNSRGMVVFGLGANASSTRREDIVNSPRAGGTGFNDLVKSARNEYQNDSFAVPMLMGAEVEISKFAKWSGAASHNVISGSKTKSTADTYAATTGALSSRTILQSESDADGGWKFATGLGFYFGSLTWDIAVNDSFLASSGGWVNPAYQSTLSWGY